MKKTKNKTKAQLAAGEKKRVGRKGRGRLDVDIDTKLKRMMPKPKKTYQRKINLGIG